MLEDIPILNYILILLFVSVQLYMTCENLSKSIKRIRHRQEDKYDSYLENDDTDEEDEYENYLENNGCKRYESVDTIDDEEDNKLISIELDFCNEFIKNNMKNIYAIERRASLYYLLDNYENSINDYKYLMRREPENFSYVQGCAMSYAHWKNLNSALRLINNFYIDKKQDSEYFNALGDVFFATENYQLAIKNYSEAIKLEPNWLYYSNRAGAYRQNGEIDKSRADDDKSKELYNARFK